MYRELEKEIHTIGTMYEETEGQLKNKELQCNELLNRNKELIAEMEGLREIANHLSKSMDLLLDRIEKDE